MKKSAEQAYELYMEVQRKSSRGSRKERLSVGNGHAERKFMINVWWPVFGEFEGLLPEYEIMDEKDGPRFLDFAYFAGAIKLCIEIDGYGPHWKMQDAGNSATMQCGKTNW